MKTHILRRPVMLAAAWLLGAVASAALVGCGGGGTANTDAKIVGVAAVGAPLPNAAITVRDATNTDVTTTAAEDGSYEVNVTGKTAPFMIQATGMVGGVSTTYYSALQSAPLSGEKLTANVTPLTNAIVAQAISGDPAAVFTDVKASLSSISSDKVKAARDKLLAALNDYIVALGGTKDADPITTSFSANSKDALDKVLDLVKISTQVSGSGSSSKADVTLAPNGGGITAVKQDDSLATTVAQKLPVPSDAEKALDTSGLKTFAEGINTAWASKEAFGTNGANFAAWVDGGLLDSGQDKAAFVADVTANFTAATPNMKWGAKMETPVIQRCEAATLQCLVTLSVNRNNGTYGKFQQWVKQNSSGKWLIYGNRKVFDHELNWVANRATDGSVDLGYSLYVPYSAGQTLNQAVISFSTDEGKNPVSGADVTFTAVRNCPQGTSNGSGNFLVAPNACNSNFVSLTNDQIKTMNDALSKGTFRYKVVLSNNGATSGAKTQDWRRVPAALSPTRANVATFASSFPTITTSQLGSNSVAFKAPFQLNGMNVQVKVGNTVTGDALFDGPRARQLGGVVTVAKMNADCVANGSTASNCDSSYGSTGKISYVFINNRDDQDRQFWAGYGTWGSVISNK